MTTGEWRKNIKIPWNVADITLAASKESISIITGHLQKRTSTNIFKLIYITAHVKTNHVW